MIQKEINEIRRRLSPDKGAIGKIYGCFVNKNKEVISYTDASLALMHREDSEKYLTLFKKVLSGGLGRSMVNIEFSTAQVMESEEHALLMRLKNSGLKDESAREELYRKIIEAVSFEDDNYLILLTCDDYDVPVKSNDSDSFGDSETVFSYFICCVCPVKDSKPELAYEHGEQIFKSHVSPMIVSSPQLGFMFPTFEDRGANIYNSLFYTKNPAIMHEEFINSIFRTEIPMSAPEQKDTFADTLSDTLENECSFDVVQTVHEKIRERVTVHKESKIPEPLEFDAHDVCNILKSEGVSPEAAEDFEEKCTERFGDNPMLNPENIVNIKKFEIQTPQIKISVDPDYSCTVETRVIDGRKYILIPADDGVSVNGINVTIPQE
ncbi:MAG: DUF4317 domain-containing protein [Clostridia bacterium]|nr:DUF4317 domain-containing protein [Clostridia bacterium]